MRPDSIGAGGGNRTRTPLSRPRILSPVRLPVSPPRHVVQWLECSDSTGPRSVRAILKKLARLTHRPDGRLQRSDSPDARGPYRTVTMMLQCPSRSLQTGAALDDEIGAATMNMWTSELPAASSMGFFLERHSPDASIVCRFELDQRHRGRHGTLRLRHVRRQTAARGASPTAANTRSRTLRRSGA